MENSKILLERALQILRIGQVLSHIVFSKIKPLE